MVIEATLYRSLQSILGDEGVLGGEEAAGYGVDGLIPQAVALPATVEQVAEVMALAHRQGAAVIPWGGGTSMSLGNIPRRYDIALCLSRLNGTVEYEPADLTVTVQAGKTLATFQQELSERGQFLPLDPPEAEKATIGGILAANLSGPSRHACGTVRDLILGVRAVQADGRVIKAGGRVVKNVAGYDLSRLFIGSLGSLAVIVEATFRLAPLPKAQRTAVVFLPSAREAYRLARQMAGLSLGALELLDAAAARRVAALGQGPADALALVLAAAGEASAVERSLGDIRELAGQIPGVSFREVEASAQGQAWQEIADLGRPSADAASLVCKGAVLPSHLPVLFERIETTGQELALEPLLVSHLMAGVVYSIWPLPAGQGGQRGLCLLTALRRAVAGLEGSLVVEACPLALKERIDVWGEPAADFPLMRRVKEQFDPQGILSPGRFVGKL